jgi:anti-anti-sigma factor
MLTSQKTQPAGAAPTVTLKVAGDLLSTNARMVREEFEALAKSTEWSRKDVKTFRLDISKAKMVDSVGLNFVVFLIKQAGKRGLAMQVAYSTPNIHRTFVFTRLDRHLDLVKVD